MVFHVCRDKGDERVRDSARSLFFPPLLLDMADRVDRNLRGAEGLAFNGLHLRIEGDAKTHGMVERMGGFEVRTGPGDTRRCRL